MMHLSSIGRQKALLAMTGYITVVGLFILLTFPVFAESEEPDATALAIVKTESDCDKAAILDLRVVYEDEALAGLVAPPEGVYPFQPGDGVVLRAYGMGDIPVAID